MMALRGNMSAVFAFLVIQFCLIRREGLHHHHLVGALLVVDPSSSSSAPPSRARAHASSSSSTTTTSSSSSGSSPLQAAAKGGSDRVTRPEPIPITVLSGFLGSGKTSLLQSLLRNQQGLRIAVIVNDVASVNVDSRIVGGGGGALTGGGGISPALGNGNDDDRSQAGQVPAGIVQLENGCACCSLSEELLGSVSELVLLSDLRGEGMAFDHIVVELSGVADPRAVRAKFQEAVIYDMPLMERVRLDTMVTVVDCSAFLGHLRSSSLASPDQAPELFYRPGEEPSTDGAADPSWAEQDLPAPLLEALLAGDRANDGDDGGGGGSVADLLVSQCEIADVCLLNKVDLCGDNDLRQITSVVAALNPRATVHNCQYGEVELHKVLGTAGGRGVVDSGIVDDHKDAVRAAAMAATAKHASDRTDPNGGGATTHEHSHSHDHSGDGDHAVGCSDPSHDHEHDTHDGHSHSHEHSVCNDPTCNDPTHSHDHSTENFGLGSFVYRARRPFHPGRLVSFLRLMPIQRGLPASDASAVDEAIRVNPEARGALRQVLRSKGFAWSAESDVAAWYWSHAGVSFDLSCLGRWWATLRREEWPREAVDTILGDFMSDEAAQKDPTLAFVGDRRQEIVFIGPTLGASQSQGFISDALDQCLLNDEEWKTYCQLRDDDRSLQRRFPNAIETRMLTY